MTAGLTIASVSGYTNTLYEVGGGGTSRYAPISILWYNGVFSRINDSGDRCVSFMNYLPAGNPSNTYAFLHFNTHSSYSPFSTMYDFKSENYTASGTPIQMVSTPDLGRTAAWIHPNIYVSDGSGNTVKVIEFTSGFASGYHYLDNATMHLGRNSNTLLISFEDLFLEEEVVISANMWILSYDLASGTEKHAVIIDEYALYPGTYPAGVNDYGHMILRGMAFDAGGGSLGKIISIHNLDGEIISEFSGFTTNSGYMYRSYGGASKTSNEIFSFYIEESPLSEGAGSTVGFYVVDKDFNFLYSDSSYEVPPTGVRSVFHDDVGGGIYIRQDIVMMANQDNVVREQPQRGESGGTDNFIYGSVGSEGPGEWRIATTEEMSGTVIRIMSIGK